MVDKLVNWKVEKSIEKKLLYGILHRKGYQAFDRLLEKDGDERERMKSNSDAMEYL